MILESVLQSKFLCNAQKGKVQVELTSLFDFISLWTVAKLEKSILMKKASANQSLFERVMLKEKSLEQKIHFFFHLFSENFNIYFQIVEPNTQIN